MPRHADTHFKFSLEYLHNASGIKFIAAAFDTA